MDIFWNYTLITCVKTYEYTRVVFYRIKSTSIISFKYIEVLRACTNTWMTYGTS